MDFLNCPYRHFCNQSQFNLYIAKHFFFIRNCDVCVNQDENVLTMFGFAGIKASSKEILGNPNLR